MDISRRKFLGTGIGLAGVVTGISSVNMPSKIASSYEVTKAKSSFILSYDDYGKELIAKSNEIFQGTKAEIKVDNLQDNKEISNMYIFKRLPLITAIYRNQQLRSLNQWPITPLQSEQLLKQGKLPKPKKYWEDLALILYDVNGTNPNEAKALLESLKKHRTDLGLSNSDLESRLLIVNAGLEKDSSMPHGVKPVILPGLTKVYPHETLSRIEADHKFGYGLNNGLPSLSQLSQGERTLYMPLNNENIGLRVLVRVMGLDLTARDVGLVSSDAGGRVNITREKLM